MTSAKVLFVVGGIVVLGMLGVKSFAPNPPLSTAIDMLKSMRAITVGTGR